MGAVCTCLSINISANTEVLLTKLQPIPLCSFCGHALLSDTCRASHHLHFQAVLVLIMPHPLGMEAFRFGSSAEKPPSIWLCFSFPLADFSKPSLKLLCCFLLSLMWKGVVSNSVLIVLLKCSDCQVEDGLYEIWNRSKLQLWKDHVHSFQLGCCFEFGLDCKSALALSTNSLSPSLSVCLC